MSNPLARARVAAAVVVAFLSGLFFASATDLTRFGWAQGNAPSETGAARRTPASPGRAARRPGNDKAGSRPARARRLRKLST